ncbi:hypothetical protein FACS1894190_01980 [Spirochaetia bacterium]|nr:hypothetical protein FACS1894190_01980 [Spirochaetia bacterium]
MKKLFILILLCLSFYNLNAQETKNRYDYITIKIAVIGPGNELYFWWGHFGLIIEDKLTGTSRFYDYGVFSFEKENFFTNFAMGRLWFSSVVSSTNNVISHYIADNRDVTIYTLNLTSDQKAEIVRVAERNITPEYKDYLYNHFSDNCVTRITNLIDDAVDGQFYEMANNTPGRFTLRQHVRRHSYFDPFGDWLINFLMGQGIDTLTTVKQEMFLPSEAGIQINNFSYIDKTGQKQPLVSNVEIIYTSKDRPPVLPSPRENWPAGLILGISIALIFTVFIFLKNIKTVNRLFGLSIGIFGLFFGFMGTAAFFMSLFTDHDYTWHNLNVIFVNPLFFAAVPLGIIIAFTKKEQKRLLCEKLLKIFMTCILLGGILTMVLKLLPMFYQDNKVTLALLLPIAFVLSYVPDVIKAAFKRKN